VTVNFFDFKANKKKSAEITPHCIFFLLLTAENIFVSYTPSDLEPPKGKAKKAVLRPFRDSIQRGGTVPS